MSLPSIFLKSDCASTFGVNADNAIAAAIIEAKRNFVIEHKKLKMI